MQLSEKELLALRKLADQTLTAPSRPEIAPAERRALGKELADRYATLQATIAKKEAENAEDERLLAAVSLRIQQRHRELYEARSGYTSWRDPVMRRLLDERPKQADDLHERLLAEAQGLTIERADLGMKRVDAVSNRSGGELVDEGIGRALAELPRTISNAESVNARRQALHRLAEDVLGWCSRGLFGTPAELQEMFTRAYSQLPKVEALRDVLKRDVRGHELLRRMRPLPPAA